MQSMADVLSKLSPNLQQRLQEISPSQPVAPKCAVCSDRGYVQYDVPVGHEYFGKLTPCQQCAAGQEIYETRRRALVKQAGIPEKYARMTFATLHDALGPDTPNSKWWEGKRLAYHAARLFVEREGHTVSLAEATESAGRSWPRNTPDVARPGLILSGPMGVGKTGLMAAIVNYLRDAGERPLYLRTALYLEHINSRYFDKDEHGNQRQPTAADVKRQAMDAPVLALDELFMGVGVAASDSKIRLMEDIMEHRKANYLPTIITCNQSLAQIGEYWGPIVHDRVAELCHFIPMGGFVLRDTWQPFTTGDAF